MNQSPILLIVLTAAAAFLGKLWLDDRRAAERGRPNPRALPGATRAPRAAYIIAIAGVLALLALETAGEIRLGVADQQSRMTGLFAAYTLAAAVIEELIFRGYFVVERRGQAALWLGAIGASLVFAALHPFLWRWDERGFALTLTPKGQFSTAVVFATSVWLYTVRFAPWNPHRSLLPCVAAHAARNAGVIAIKAAGGYMSGWW